MRQTNRAPANGIRHKRLPKVLEMVRMYVLYLFAHKGKGCAAGGKMWKLDEKVKMGVIFSLLCSTPIGFFNETSFHQ